MLRIHLPGALVLLAACAGTPEVAPAFATRDSAGISIVETGQALWDSVPGWTVDSVPFLSVGEEDGEDPYLLGYPAGAFLRGDGSVVIADGRNQELRVFDANGRYLETKGRKGPGPAEFNRIERLARCGDDEIWIVAGRSRVAVWGVEVDYRREFTVVNNIMWPLICFNGTGLLVKRDLNEIEEDRVNTITVDSLHLMVVDSVGDTPHDLMDIPLWSRILVKTDRGGLGLIHPFGRPTLLGQAGGNLIIGFARQLEVGTYTKEGQLIRIARGPAEDMTLSSAMLKEYAAADLEGNDLQTREGLAGGGNPMPDSIPAYIALEVDRDGNIWLQRWHVPGSPDTRWGVFREDGRFLGHLTLPSGIRIHEIGRDYVLGTMMDSLYTQRVQAFRIRK